jgi:hypothetical protein
MRLKAIVLAGTAMVSLTAGLATPALATTQAVSKTASTAAFQTAGGEQGDEDISGLVSESPVCSALGAESIPTGDVVARCLAGTTLV